MDDLFDIPDMASWDIPKEDDQKDFYEKVKKMDEEDLWLEFANNLSDMNDTYGEYGRPDKYAMWKYEFLLKYLKRRLVPTSEAK
jgi:hypothetical protein